MDTAGFKTQARIPPKRGRVKLMIFRSCLGPAFPDDDRVVKPRNRGIYRGPPKRGRVKIMILRSFLELSVLYDVPPSSKSATPSPYNSDRHSDS